MTRPKGASPSVAVSEPTTAVALAPTWAESIPMMGPKKKLTVSRWSTRQVSLAD
jgi:hypothetical protein